MKREPGFVPTATNASEREPNRRTLVAKGRWIILGGACISLALLSIATLSRTLPSQDMGVVKLGTGEVEVFLSLTLFQDGSRVAVGTGVNRDGAAVRKEARILILDGKTFATERQLESPNRVDGVRVSGNHLAAFSTDEGVVRVWKMDGGKVPYRQMKVNGGVVGGEFSPDGRFFIFPSTLPDSFLCFWDFEAERANRLPAGKGLSPMSVAVSAKSDLIATGNADTVEFYDLKKQELRFAMPWTSTRNYSAMAFTPDGRFLAVAGSRKVIQIWGVSGKQEAVRWAAILMPLKALPSTHPESFWRLDASIRPSDCGMSKTKR